MGYQVEMAGVVVFGELVSVELFSGGVVLGGVLASVVLPTSVELLADNVPGGVVFTPEVVLLESPVVPGEVALARDVPFGSDVVPVVRRGVVPPVVLVFPGVVVISRRVVPGMVVAASAVLGRVGVALLVAPPLLVDPGGHVGRTVV